MQNNLKPNAIVELPKSHGCIYGDTVRVRLDDGSCHDAIYISPSTGWSPLQKIHLVRIDNSPWLQWVGGKKPTKNTLRFVYPVERMELYRAKVNN